MGETESSPQENTYTINFHDVPVVEFIQFVSKISDVNFIFNHRDLHFNVTLSSGKPATPQQVVKALVQVLRAHGMSINREDGYYVIHKGGEEFAPLRSYEKRQEAVPSSNESPALVTSLQPLGSLGGALSSDSYGESKPNFLVYRLQYHDEE